MATQNREALTRVTILRRKQVEARTGLARSTIYQKVSEGSFPKPVSLGARAVGWIESEVDDWLSLQIRQSRNTH
jgi:prophage regulatory protein